MNCASYQAAYEFINAWKIHDTAALRLSTSAEISTKNGKPYYMPTLVLQRETDWFVHAKQVFSDELGINHVHLMKTLLELRRDGVDHESAVETVIGYLESQYEAS